MISMRNPKSSPFAIDQPLAIRRRCCKRVAVPEPNDFQPSDPIVCFRGDFCQLPGLMRYRARLFTQVSTASVNKKKDARHWMDCTFESEFCLRAASTSSHAWCAAAHTCLCRFYSL